MLCSLKRGRTLGPSGGGDVNKPRRRRTLSQAQTQGQLQQCTLWKKMSVNECWLCAKHAAACVCVRKAVAWCRALILVPNARREAERARVPCQAGG
ncbi:hypothetical protein MHYP_G00234130 [Metynnis hypsauchen]